jgi:hypothetical protein
MVLVTRIKAIRIISEALCAAGDTEPRNIEKPPGRLMQDKQSLITR